MTKTLTEQQIRKILEKGTFKAAKVCEKKFYGKPKSLTEQWRDGTLPCGAYYVNRLNEIRIYLVAYENEKNTHEIYEVLAPVPSYDEWKKLDDELKELATKNDTLAMENGRLQEQLNEKGLWIGVLKSHLEECWEILKLYAEHDYLTPEDFYMRDRLESYYRRAGLGNIEDAKKLLEKCGVK